MRLPAIFAVLLGCLIWPAPASASPESGVSGVITIGPVHGGPARDGIPHTRPVGNAMFIVKCDDRVITTFTTDEQGRFRIALAPGHYSVSKQRGENEIGSYGPFDVDVVAGTMTEVQWNCDDGRM
jgi:hypothetical protein